MSDANDTCCGGGSCGEPTRRTFLQQAAVVGAGFLSPIPPELAGGPQDPRGDHLVPADKGLRAEWLQALRQKGAPVPFAGAQLRTAAMPCGGIAAGQLYVTGDGRLARWWLANDACHTSYGGDTEVTTPTGTIGVCYGTYGPEQGDVQQGTLLAWRRGDGPFEVAGLGGDEVETTFLGEYPVATIDYRRARAPLPVQVRAEVFSPFVPLQAKDSALPAVLLRYTLRNDGKEAVTAVLASWLQNPVLRSQRGVLGASLRNTVVREQGLSAVAMDAVELPQGHPDEGVVFEDFEQGYGKWQAEGEALGSEPAAGTLEKQQPVSGFHGERLVNTFRGGDDTTGRLRSPEFAIEKRYIAFRIGGGQDLEKLSLSLAVRDRSGDAWTTVRRATGQRREALRESCWDVGDLVGARAQLVIEDGRKGGWGHVNVDHIRFCDAAPELEPLVPTHPQAGEVLLCALDAAATVHPELSSAGQVRQWLAGGAGAVAALGARQSLDRPPLGAVASTVTLQPGEQRTLTFAITWFFPNRQQRPDEGLHPGQQCGTDGPRVGNRYAAWFASALAVAQHLQEHGERLVRDTMLFRDALYRDTTLPGWFTQRIGMPLSTLATGVLQWWEDGRVWAWEGVGCCAGTCGHVWNYAQGMARLFPELERSVREHQDFAPDCGLRPDGAIGFRGTPRNIWAGDAQGGYVLKAWREHLCSPDDAFLRRTWPAVKQALQFLIGQDGGEDGEPDGVLEGKQHNTYDIEFFGANTMVGSMYLGALAAGAKMAERMGDGEFAARCAELLRRGSEVTMQRLWNGEYFVQQVDQKAHPKWQYGDGCLGDQLLGQWFADQLGLGYLYPRDAVRTALQSIWKYNWAPDCGPQMRAHEPERDFAHAGEAGLFLCTWPRSAHPGGAGVRYRDEVWSGIEYQVAAHLLREGFVTEGLAIVRGIHERYDGVKHNPYNEVECGDHYARALASWSCLLAISGFEHDGPAGMLGMAPRIDAGDFRCFFAASEGWGTLQQTRSDGKQQNAIAVRWGTLRVRELRFEVAAGHAVKEAVVTVRGAGVAARLQQEGVAVALAFAEPVAVAAGEAIDVRMQ